MGVSKEKERRNRAEEIFENIKARNFTNLIKYMMT
jgi:hypothetical protein